jgi:ABC-type transport system involved in multi-copper enzyme maturation permease subunit
MSKAITEKPGDTSQSLRWQAPMEVAPSAVEDSVPVVARWIGAIGLALVVLGGVAVLTSLWGRANIIGPQLGGFFLFLGVGGLLYHAANDAELQIRRVYLVLAMLLLALGAGLSVLPMLFKSDPSATRFLPWGLPCFLLGLLFTMAFVRNETEAKIRDIAVYAVGGLGAVMAVVGFLFSNVYPATFLLPYGVLLVLLGLGFLWAFVAFRGVADDLGYWVGLGIGAVGLVFFLIALGRSGLPPLLERMHVLGPGSPRFLLPSGLVLMVASGLYVALAAGLCSDRQFVVLVRRELGSIFHSPLIYLVLVMFVFLGEYMYLDFLGFLLQLNPATGAITPRQVPEPVVSMYIADVFPIITVLMLVPVLTMRLLSEEHRTGTLEMTFTAPVDEWVVVLSKFTAALIFFLLVWLPWGLYLADLRAEGGTSFDVLPLIGFFVAVLFTGAGFISMGLFFSSLTRNQLIAAVFTFVGMLLLLAFAWARNLFFVPDALKTAMGYIAFLDKWRSAIQGKLAVRDLIVYLSMAVFWLFLTVKVLESRKWR